ncbi:MAG: 5-oxoprolinase subunit PxpB [Blastocatellia bacterium]|nr:5-oxoprolinase subunit PxpB [Blastocatellia bacterium]
MRMFSLGENAVTVELGDAISEDLNRRAIALSHDLAERPFAGFVEAVPSYASVTAFFDVAAVRRANPWTSSACEVVRAEMESRLAALEPCVVSEEPRTVEVLVDFSEGPDLEMAAASCGISVPEFIEIFTARPYRVFMIGFQPGFAYMGQINECISLPRLATPRLRVPKGSVGIAGRQTGIYPFDSPGGWQLIGRTDVELFRPLEDPPTLFKPGDMCRFVDVGG